MNNNRYYFALGLQYTAYTCGGGSFRDLASDVTYEECRKACADYIKTLRNDGAIVTMIASGWEWKCTLVGVSSIQITCTSSSSSPNVSDLLDAEDYLMIEELLG